MVQEVTVVQRFTKPLLSRWRGAIVHFARVRPVGMAGAVALLALVIVAALAPWVATHDPIEQDVPQQFRAPSSTYWMGTDHLGRDVYSRVVYGSRISLYVGLLSVGVATVVGILIGVSSAYFGGLFDLLMQRFIDTLMGMPALILAMVLMFALGASLNNVVIAITISFMPRVVRIVRSEALAVKEFPFVTAAVAMGASVPRILGQHIIPNTLTSVFVYATGALGAAIVTEASLSFLGLGIPPPTPSWGQMLQGAARLYMERAPWLVTFPGLAITIVVFSFNMFGDALRDVLDPRLRQR
ncbi:MAG: ABC transporter permease [Chloroflexi bacterium]|nr:ABC transporter permease [Chloroflexota bacterium]